MPFEHVVELFGDEVRLRLEVLLELSDPEVQTFVREVDPLDLAWGLVGVGEPLTAKVRRNLSPRVWSQVEEDMARFPSYDPDELLAVRQRLLEQFAQMVEEGRLSWSPSGPAGAPAEREPQASCLALKDDARAMLRRPLVTLTGADLDRLFVSLATICRTEGPLALDPLLPTGDGGFLALALERVIDVPGPDPEESLLPHRMRSLLHRQRTKYEKALAGLIALTAGDHPALVGRKLQQFGPAGEEPSAGDSPSAGSPAESAIAADPDEAPDAWVRTALERPLAILSDLDIDRLFVALASIGRAEGLPALERLLPQDREGFVVKALDSLIAGTDPDTLDTLLGHWADSLLRQEETKCRKIIEGTRALQAGDNPRMVEQRLAAIF